MVRVVLDASVAMRWILHGELAPLARRVRDKLLDAKLELIVPALWHWEMANGVAILERRSIIDSHAATLAWKQVEYWAALMETESGPRVPVASTFALARRYGITAYDAAYLELAVRLAAPLATLDQQLRGAALRAGVEVNF